MSIIGREYGRLLCERGDSENGLAVLGLPAENYSRLGDAESASGVAELVRKWSTVGGA